MPKGWHKNLGVGLESALWSLIVCFLIVLDVVCAVLSDTLEDTDILNPKYEAVGEEVLLHTRRASLAVLGIFMIEQGLSIVAFGRLFFTHIWKVLDLGVVTLSLLFEIIGTEDELRRRSRHVAMWFRLLRMWKPFSMVFELVLLRYVFRQKFVVQRRAEEKLEEQSPSVKSTSGDTYSVVPVAAKVGEFACESNDRDCLEKDVRHESGPVLRNSSVDGGWSFCPWPRVAAMVACYQ